MLLFEKEAPGDSVQVDVKVVKLQRETVFQYTAIDDCTRYRVLRLYPRQNQHASLHFLEELRAHLPFPVRKVQCDNGLPSKSRARLEAQLLSADADVSMSKRGAKRVPPTRNHTLTIVTQGQATGACLDRA